MADPPRNDRLVINAAIEQRAHTFFACESREVENISNPFQLAFHACLARRLDECRVI